VLDQSAVGRAHQRLWQVLGVRMGLLSVRSLGLEAANVDRRLVFG